MQNIYAFKEIIQHFLLLLKVVSYRAEWKTNVVMFNKNNPAMFENVIKF